MNAVKIITSIILVLSLGFANAQSIDSAKSTVEFEIGNMKIMEVEGSFSGMKGEVKFHKTDLKNSFFNVCIDAASVNTEHEKRDEHLKNEDFFDVSKYPNICFESTSFEREENGFLVKGNLKMHGVSNSVEIPFSIDGNVFKGEFTISRLDFGVGTGMSTFMVSKNVEIEITCVLK